MAGNTIKGLTVEIGGDTTKLGKALENVNKKSRALSSELGQINKLLKLDPGNTELMAQKQKVLADAISNTKEKLETLKRVEQQVQEQFKRGEVSEAQVRELQREIIATEKKLGSYEKAAKETAETLEKLGDGAEDAADGLEDTAKGAKKAEDASEDLGSSLDGTLSTGFKTVTALAIAASAALVGCAEGSAEYRREMGKLDTAFTTAGHNQEAAMKTYKSLQGVLGETDQAVEAANHLAKLADTEEDLEQLTDALTGVYATFGASLPVEGLAEAANETAKVGQVTGSMADAINWAGAETEEWYNILGDNTKALKAFKKATEDGEKVEDAYTAALGACSNEQERQQLITKTLTKLYGKAATQYKKTNKEVIRSNEANEEWNATLAEMGETVAPVVTDIKLFGVELAKNAEQPLKKLTLFLRNTALPTLTSMSSWALSNLPAIGSAVAGATATLVAYKAATIANEVAQKGLKGAIMATTVAQNALNLAQKATPAGLVAAAIAGLITAYVVYCDNLDVTKNKVNALTEKERMLLDASLETADALREQRSATEETAGGITSQMQHIESLADELQRLADKSGKVKESDEARAKFILTELNNAIGTEYEMTDGIIQKYDELTGSINDVIAAKTANALLEAHNADFVAALQAEGELLQGLTLAEKEHMAAKQKYEKWYQDYTEEYELLTAEIEKADEERDIRTKERLLGKRAALEVAHSHELSVLEEAKTAYDEVARNYGENAEVIMNYEEAQTAALSGNYTRASELLKGKATSFHDYADEVDEATAQVLDTLYREAINAGLEAEHTKKNFEAGVKGFTKEMVDEAEQGYEDALNSYADAYNDAHGVGEDLGDGLADGMESKRSSVLEKIRNIVSAIIGAARKEADSHSPSRKMIDLGEDMGEGAEIGLENKTKDLLTVAEDQMERLLDVYGKGFDPSGQITFNALQKQSMHAQSQSYKTAEAVTASKLDKILVAIERGQILTIDSETLVGATADRFDNKLGQKRILAVRGAI